MPFCGCVAEYCENVDWRPLNLLVPVHTYSLNCKSVLIFRVYARVLCKECVLGGEFVFFVLIVYWLLLLSV